MNPSPSLPVQTTLHEHSLADCWRSRVSWPAIFAGLTAAVALEVLFMLLGAGLGFAIYNPITSENPVSSLGAGALVVQGMSAVVSLWLGGWVAGRFIPGRARASACLHGFIVWCSATVAGVVLVAAGAGWILGDISKLVGGGLSAAAQPAAEVADGATDLAKDALKQSDAALTSFTDEALGNRPADAAPGKTVRAKREIGLAVARLFNPRHDINKAEARAELVKVLSSQTGMSEAEANERVTEWTATYDRLQEELTAVKEAAEQKAREAADTAAKALTIFSLVYFAGFLLGAVAAGCGACHGAQCATKYDGLKNEPVS
jgi:hypothetical protein